MVCENSLAAAAQIVMGTEQKWGKNPIYLMNRCNPNTDPTVGYFLDDL